MAYSLWIYAILTSLAYRIDTPILWIRDIAPLPPRAQRHPWLRYKVDGYTTKIIQDVEDRLEDMRQGLTNRLRMVYTGDEGQVLFTIHAWRRLFEDGGARCSMSWRQFILALGLHTADCFRWRFLGDGSLLYIYRDPLRRICHRLIAVGISCRGQPIISLGSLRGGSVGLGCQAAILWDALLSTLVIMEYLMKISEKARILDLKRRNMKITVLTPNTPYPSRKIWHICSCTSLKTTKEKRSIR
ncbi:hypothetical protein Tco_1062301, partial [Tanacetum coccineum]